MTAEIIETGWSEPRTVPTAQGQRNLRTLPLQQDCDFWTAWRADKEAVKAAGFACGKDRETGAWVANHWESETTPFGPALAEFARIVAEAKGEEMLSLEQQRIDFVPENFAELTTPQAAKLYDWQRPSCQRIIAALVTGNALDASQTGAGKTAVALTTCAEMGLTPYVIAPLAVLEGWRREARRVGVTLGSVTNYDKARAGSVPWIRKEMIQGPPSRNGKLPKPEPRFSFNPPPTSDLFLAGSRTHALLIFDEVQKTKSHDSLQGRLLAHTAAAGTKILCLSATAAKDPTEMYALGLTLGLHKGGDSYFSWARQHECKTGTYGLKFTDSPKVAAEVIQRIHRKLFPARGSRIRSADVPGYPDNNVTAHLVENRDIVNAYHAMDSELELIEEKVAAGKMDKKAAAAADMAELMKARRASEKGKLDFFIDEAKELIADGFQVVVFLNFREHLAIMRAELKLRSAPVWGTAWLRRESYQTADGEWKERDVDGPAQKPHERQRIIDDFQAGREKIILVSLQAGGAGVNLHDEFGLAPRQSLISPSYSIIDLVQSVGRIWRASSHSKATQRIIFAAGTVEEEIAASLESKCANLEMLNDHDLMPDSIAKVLAETDVTEYKAAALAA